MSVFIVNHSQRYGEYLDTEDEIRHVGLKERFQYLDANKNPIPKEVIRDAICASGGRLNIEIQNVRIAKPLGPDGNHCYVTVIERVKITILPSQPVNVQPSMAD